MEILRALVLHGPHCLPWPNVARALIRADLFFADAVHAELARAMMVNPDWRAAVRWLREHRGRVPERRLCDFTRWAEKVSQRKVRGLLMCPEVGGRSSDVGKPEGGHGC